MAELRGGMRQHPLWEDFSKFHEKEHTRRREEWQLGTLIQTLYNVFLDQCSDRNLWRPSRASMFLIRMLGPDGETVYHLCHG